MLPDQLHCFFPAVALSHHDAIIGRRFQHGCQTHADHRMIVDEKQPDAASGGHALRMRPWVSEIKKGSCARVHLNE